MFSKDSSGHWQYADDLVPGLFRLKTPVWTIWLASDGEADVEFSPVAGAVISNEMM